MIPDQYDHGHPIRSVDTPPAEPAVQPASPPHYAGHTPGYGPNPTAQGVRGYRDLPADDVTLINAVKELQENVANVWAAVYVRPGTDTRWADIARLHLEEGVSALVRSVAKPHDPFRSALDNLRADAEQRAREAIERDLARSKMDAPGRPSGESTVEQDPAQQSHDHRPDEGSHA